MNSNTNYSFISNPFVIVMLILIALIIILGVFRSVSPSLTLGLGLNAHIGDLRGSFELETFDNSSESSFVIFYAEWCGHCKRAMPEFNKLMDNYNGNIKLLAINSELEENKELIKSQRIQGFPTIRYYPNGLNGQFDEYKDGRTYDEFLQYLNNVSGADDRTSNSNYLENAAPF